MKREPKYLAVIIPHSRPTLLQIRTSSTQLSHQHSLKFGMQWRKVSSMSSKPTETVRSRA